MSELTAGRALDLLVAENVLGWKRGTRFGNGNGEWIVPGDGLYRSWETTPRFSTNIADAWAVVKQTVADRDWRWQVGEVRGLSHVTICALGATLDMRAAPSMPLAICRAALEAVASSPSRASHAQDGGA